MLGGAFLCAADLEIKRNTLSLGQRDDKILFALTYSLAWRKVTSLELQADR